MVNKSVRILHVDDLEEDFILLRELLSMVQDVDFEFQWASDIQAAAQIMHNTEFDVCFIDYYIGIHNGLEFIQNAIADGITIPFILMTGQENQEIYREAVEIGARQCFNKNDLTTSNLLKAVQAVISS